MIRVLVGHVLERLAELPAESVHCVVTSPPYYGLRDYGIEPQVWGGQPGCEHEWGDEQISAANDSNRGSMDWTTGGNPAAKVKGERVSQGAFCRRCGAWRGSLGLEPTPALYIEHMVAVFREVRRVLRKDGTLWLNIGDSYASGGTGGTSPKSTLTGGGGRYRDGSKLEAMHEATQSRKAPPGIKPKDLLGIPWMLAFALRDDGWWLRSEITWAKRAPMPESCTDRPTTATEKVFLLTRSARYFYDAEAVKEEAEKGAAGSFFDQGKTAEHQLGRASHNPREETGKRNMRNWWLLGPEPFPEAHFATFPTEIPRRAILAGSKPGGTVLDPFLGAGTTALVADRLGRHCIGLELNPKYAAMAERRCREEVPLFAEIAAE